MKKVLALLASLSVFFISCVNPLSNDSKEQYGSISIQNNESRAMDVSTITSADVVVSGYGMEDITKTGVSVTAGKGSIVITKIPAGTNRVVTVKSNVDGAVMRAVVDIVADTTTECTVNWKGTAVGNIFYELIKTQNVAVSSISKTAFDSYIPQVHSSLVNAAQIASDYKNNSLGTADSYILSYGTVAVNTTGLSGWKVQITDIASEVKEITSDSESYEVKATPGSWKVWVYDASGELREDKIQNIVIASGYTTQVNINYQAAGTPVTGKIIVHVPTSLGYKYIWAWNPTSTATNYTGGTWPGKEMTKNGSYYDYTLDGRTVAGIIFNKDQNGSSAGNGQTADLYITEGNLYRLIFQSRKEEAIQFTDWVTEIVIPSIRKYGRYDVKTITGSKEAAINFLESYHELKVRNNILEVVNEETAEARKYVKEATDSGVLRHLFDVPAILKIKGINKQTLFSFLRSHDVLNEENLPTQEYIDKGWFRVDTHTYINKKAVKVTHITPMVYQTGIKGIRELLTKWAGKKC